MNDYKEKLKESAKELDTVLGLQGEIYRTVEHLIKSKSNEQAYKLVEILNKISTKKNSKEEKAVENLYDCIVSYVGYKTIREIEDSNKFDDTEKTLDQLLNELDSLIGLHDVKRLVKDLIVYQQIRLKREEYSLFSEKNTLHLAFLGNPGTGKTTVARIIGHIYKQIGLLSKGHFVEASRTDLIAGYQGQTALKVKKLIDRSRGGVLFIDEAYSITENDHSDSYGRECLTELTKALEDYREDLVVIVAGYTEPMRKFFESNPGLKSRFNNYIEFPDYTADELYGIMEYTCEKNDYIMSDSLQGKIKEYFNRITCDKADNFANGRLVRNIFNDLIMNHARRLYEKESVSKEELMILDEQDFDH